MICCYVSRAISTKAEGAYITIKEKSLASVDCGNSNNNSNNSNNCNNTHEAETRNVKGVDVTGASQNR